jgi:hypothetical protein
MANKIVLKKSSIASKVPTTSDLDYGELALNYADGKLYFKDTNNDIKNFTSGSISSQTGSFGITIDGGGSAITTGVKGYVTIPYNCTITGWTLVADVSGSIVIDVWKDVYANYPPTVADTIAGTEKPTLSSAIKNQDLSPSTWTTTVTAGDVIGFNVDSAVTITRVHLIINTTKV